SKPIVYEHFAGKEGLYAVIVDREVEHIVGRIVEAISSGSPRERLERAALAFLAYVKERPGGFAVLLRDAPPSKRSGEMPALVYAAGGPRWSRGGHRPTGIRVETPEHRMV